MWTGLGGVSLSGNGARCLQPLHRWLVDGDDTQLVLDALNRAVMTRRPDSNGRRNNLKGELR
jgi:hypothetical protein